MVLLLEEADDPNAKLLPPGGPPVTRVTVDESVILDSDEDESSAVPLTHDPPPSYLDVQGFRERIKKEEAASIHRAKRRFWVALAIALSICSLPTISAILLSRSNTSLDIKLPEPTTTDPGSAPTRGWPWDPGHDEHPPGRDPGERDPWPHPGGGERHGGRPGSPGDGRRPPPSGPGGEEEWHSECSDWIREEDPNSDDDPPAFAVNYTMSNTQPIHIRSFLRKAGGNIRVSLDDNLPADDAYVKIIARSIPSDKLGDAEICVWHGPHHEAPLDIKAKGSAAESAIYSIHLFLSSRKSRYPGIALGLPRFSQVFDDFSDSEFYWARIGGDHAAVSVTSLAAQWMNVWTSNGSIDGVFTAKRWLEINGDSEAITVTANLCNENRDSPTSARIASSHGSIEAKVVLCEKKDHPRPPPDDRFHEDGPPPGKRDPLGRYEVYITNSDSPISVQVEHANPQQGSSLWLNVTNLDNETVGNSHTMVTLDTGFEGKFRVKSFGESALPVTVKSEDATDEEGVIRQVEIEQVVNDGRSISGKVYWNAAIPPMYPRRSDVWVSTAGGGEVSLLLPSD